MARKPRIEFAGAIYHVLNRGNYRADLFDTPGAAQAFVDCLFQACERMGWRLYAFCLMLNHYHLALETPRGNLVEGVHWLQSTFGNRFNRFRNERGRAFQGRYQSILVEPGHHLASLVDYIHLNPVNAGIVSLDLLPQFRWSSYRYFMQSPERRPAFLACTDWLTASGALTDTPAGWHSYREHLSWLLADKGRQKLAGFDRMARGWMLGGKDFQAAMLAQYQRMKVAQDWGGAPVRELNRLEWAQSLEEAMTTLGYSPGEAIGADKSAPWKIAIATHLKRTTSVSNRWLTERLHMGAPDAVSRYVGDCEKGRRDLAQAIMEQLTTKVRG